MIMDRRSFLLLSSAGLLDFAVGSSLSTLKAKESGLNGKYSIVMLGDTHFDTEPASVYHSNYNEKVEWLNRVQRAEFARNGEMWRERCPRLLRRAAELVDKDTRMIFQMGDLIQGDCGKGEVHQKMLEDVMNHFKGELGGLPFISVAGNHDIRGVDAEKVYHEYMPARISQELGQPVSKTTFYFSIGEDVYLFVDFNKPDDDVVETALRETEGVRHTFLVTHGPVFPCDGGSCRWFLYGGNNDRNNTARRHFRKEFARRHTICLCGHTHRTDLLDWYGDGGRITQMTMNSVWSKDELANYELIAERPDEFGKFALGKEDVKDHERALFDEYRPGVKIYKSSKAAGSYKMLVTKKHVRVDFYAGDSQKVTQSFKLR